MTARALPAMPAAAVLAVVTAAPRFMTARQISDRLATAGYEWPNQRRGGTRQPTYDRVFSALVTLERRGQVRRVRVPNDDLRWKAVRP